LSAAERGELSIAAQARLDIAAMKDEWRNRR